MTKRALITGASRGLGFAMAEALSPAYHIVAVARTIGGLEALDDNIKSKGGAATLAPIDIADASAISALASSIAERWGGLDLWVHSAIHTAPLTPTPHIDAKDWLKTVDVNVSATAHLITLIAPLLGDDGTALFFDDDVAGQKFTGSYGSSKAAQIALAKSWQAESRSTGPNILIASPNPMDGALRARFYPGENRTPLAKPQSEALRILSESKLI